MLAYVGLIVPVLPDVPFLLAGFLIYDFLLPGKDLGWFFWSSVVILMISLFVIDYMASGWIAKKYGGSNWSMIASILGILIFPFIMGPIGLIVGPFILVVVVELTQNKTIKEAFKVGFGTLIGFLGSILVKLFTITGLLVWFFIRVFV